MARRFEQPKQKKPLIVICSEGGKKSSEYYYFRNYSNRNLRIQFSTGNNTDPKGMLNDLIKYIQNEDIKSEDNVRIFLVLDTDLNEKRIETINEIESKCKKNNIEIATSSPTFEIWFLMHFRNKKLIFNSSKEVKKELENIIKGYSETMDVYNVIKDKTENAKKTAVELNCQYEKNGNCVISSNPHTDIYKILEAIEKFNNIK